MEFSNQYSHPWDRPKDDPWSNSPTLTGKIFTCFPNILIIPHTNNGSHSLLCILTLPFQKHIFNTVSHSLAQAGHKLVTILLPQPPEYGNDRSELPYPVFCLFPNLFLHLTFSVCPEFHFSFLSSFSPFFYKSRLYFSFFKWVLTRLASNCWAPCPKYHIHSLSSIFEVLQFSHKTRFKFGK